MLLNNKLCADVGTVNCPCYLAEYGKCLVCSRLGGSVEPGTGKCVGTCDCTWQGVCIYNEYLQNNLCGSGELRTGRLCKIQKIRWFNDDLAVLRISVPRGMAEKAALPGSFVFVRAPGTESYFDFPISVLRADYEGSAIELAVKINGPKSRALMEEINGFENKLLIDDEKVAGYVELRGIYRNGLLGVEKLIRAQGPVRVLCLTKGIGIAPVANYIRWVQAVGYSSVERGLDAEEGLPNDAEAGVQIDVIADLEKINQEFADYALGLGVAGEQGNEMRAQRVGRGGAGSRSFHSVIYDPLPLKLSWAEQEKYDVIVISASEYYQQNIYVPEAKKVFSNNASMCCGEGVCGACMCMGRDGGERRMCKETGIEKRAHV